MGAKSRYKLVAPVVREHPLQRQINDVLTIEIAPAGRISSMGVVWWAVDIANYGGTAPGTRLARGVIAGILDTFVLWRGRSHFIEIKAVDGKLSEWQELLAAAILAGGGKVAIVRCAGEVLEALDFWKVPRAGRVRGIAA